MFKIPEWVTGFLRFLLKACGYIMVGVLINFIAMHFLALPSSRADLFSLIEVLFGIVITALAIIASFAVSSQWRDFELSIKSASEDLKKIAEEHKNVLLRGNEDLAKAAEESKNSEEAYNNLRKENITLMRTIEDKQENINRVIDTYNKQAEIFVNVADGIVKKNTSLNIEQLVAKEVEKQLKLNRTTENTNEKQSGSLDSNEKDITSSIKIEKKED